MPLINCEVNLELTWSKDCVVTNSTGEGKFQLTEKKIIYSSCNFINTRQCEITSTIKIWF